jgi:FMN-dependent NADH-azoreductase
MTNILHITSSIFNDGGQSTQMSQTFIKTLQHKNPDIQVVDRNLAEEPIPHITADIFGAFTTPLESRTQEQQEHVDYSDTLVAELKASDVIVLAVPMYNFSIPSTLKAWIDQIARAGQTFKYTENGSVGLLGGKKVYIFAARGGLYAGTELDSQTVFLKTFLGFLGLTDIEFVYAEGLAMGDESRTAGIDKAHQQIDSLIAA